MRYVSPSPQSTPVTPIAYPVSESVEGTAHSQDNAVTLAQGSLWYSAVYMAVFAVVVAAGGGLVWWMRPKVDLFLVVLVALLAWGLASYAILSYNREQGLHHSPTGVEHHRLDVQETVALHVIDSNVYLLERKWEREADGLEANRRLLERREPPAAG
jgi:hypothetical protein